MDEGPRNSRDSQQAEKRTIQPFMSVRGTGIGGRTSYQQDEPVLQKQEPKKSEDEMAREMRETDNKTYSLISDITDDAKKKREAEERQRKQRIMQQKMKIEEEKKQKQEKQHQAELLREKLTAKKHKPAQKVKVEDHSQKAVIQGDRISIPIATAHTNPVTTTAAPVRTEITSNHTDTKKRERKYEEKKQRKPSEDSGHSNHNLSNGKRTQPHEPDD